MKYIDLELNRWMYHNTVHVHTAYARSTSEYHSYWKEHGAFVSTLPRQVGKTEAIVKIAKTIMSKNCPKDFIGEVLVVVPALQYKSFLQARIHPDKVKSAHNLEQELQGMNLSNTHLFIDEYDFIPKTTLNNILDHPWKSVSMFSTLR